MMDPKKIAEDAVKAIFDASETEGRVIHKDTAIEIVERFIRAAMPAPTPVWGYGVAMSLEQQTTFTLNNPEEWR